MRRAVAGAVVLGVCALLAACGRGSGSLTVTNESDVDVRVSALGQHVTVGAWGAIEMLGVGCVSDVVVELPSAEPVTIAGPVCPEDSILVSGTRVVLHEGPDRS